MIEKSYLRDEFLEEEYLTVENLEKKHPLVDLCSDAGFKYVFGRAANKEILLNFLNQVISDRKIVDLSYGRNEQIPENKHSKASRFDLYCTTNDGSRIIVELQAKYQPFFVDRTLYYSTLPILEQVRSGTDCYRFDPVYCINILAFKLKELEKSDEVLSFFRFFEKEKNIELTNKQTIIYIELPKFNKSLEEIDKENALDVFFFCLKNIKDFKTIPASLDTKLAKRIFEAAATAAMTTEQKIQYIRNMTTQRDIRNQMQYEREQGIELGIKQGQEKGIELGIKQGSLNEKLRIAKSCKNCGIALELIAQCTGLSTEEVLAL